MPPTGVIRFASVPEEALTPTQAELAVVEAAREAAERRLRIAARQLRRHARDLIST